MHFKQRTVNNIFNIKYLEENVEETDVIKLLGLSIDGNLTWKNHTEQLTKKVNSFAYALFQLSHVAKRETVLIAYHGYVVSLLRYGIIFWGNSTNKQDVFIAQKGVFERFVNYFLPTVVSLTLNPCKF